MERLAGKPAFLIMSAYMSRLIYLPVALIFCLLASCETRENAKPAVYEGPITEGEQVQLLYVEHDVLKLKVNAKKIQEFVSGDREFPEGLYMEFYDETGKITSTLKANHAYYFEKENQWRGRGNVEVKNLESNEQLNSEELFWKPDSKRIFTEKFVTIRQQNDIIYGTGLDAAQDLSDYRISHPEGEIAIDEESDQP
jgi:LPS export ABC transporter protein LptC